MEITLEKIELVKDRTGVSYKEAKEALEAANGSVVDAIINIEENINVSGGAQARDQAAQIVDNIKELVRKGNIARIRIKKDNETIFNLPVNIGLVGTVLAPWAALIGVIAAFGTKCQIELVKEDGDVIDLSEKAGDKFDGVREKSSDIADAIKEKGSAVYDSVKHKAQDTVGKSRRASREKTEDFKDTVDEMWEEAKKRVSKAEESSDETAEEKTEADD
jgi:hypothetical protein